MKKLEYKALPELSYFMRSDTKDGWVFTNRTIFNYVHRTISNIQFTDGDVSEERRKIYSFKPLTNEQLEKEVLTAIRAEFETGTIKSVKLVQVVDCYARQDVSASNIEYEQLTAEVNKSLFKIMKEKKCKYIHVFNYLHHKENGECLNYDIPIYSNEPMNNEKLFELAKHHIQGPIDVINEETDEQKVWASHIQLLLAYHV